MKYTLEQRLEIGREIYSKSISIYDASIKYGINHYTARDYMRLYRDKYSLPQSNEVVSESDQQRPRKRNMKFISYEELESLNKDELIDEVIKARVEAERSKKGYYVKGGGQEKEFISLKKENLK